MNKRSWILIAVLGMIALVATMIVLGLQGSVFGGGYTSNGERIYFTATNESGERITYSGGPAFSGMMMGSQYACVSCHGRDARGGVHLMMMQVMDAPDMRWAALAGLDTFRNAVVDGVRPDDVILSSDMPRWNLSDEDLSDLAEFLKSPSFYEENENDWWIIFPIIGIIVMFIFMLLVFRRGGTWSNRYATGRDYGERRGKDTAGDILKKRFARGEITKEEYDSMLEDIKR